MAGRKVVCQLVCQQQVGVAGMGTIGQRACAGGCLTQQGRAHT